MAKITGYELSRRWFDFCFSNPEKITPTHTALYLFAVEHCNRLGWKRKFGLPTEMAKDALGIKSWHTYIKVFNDIVAFGFFELVEKSKNQYSSNIIALIKNDEALDEALDKATSKHSSKQLQSNDSIDKLLTINQELITNNIDLILENLETWINTAIDNSVGGSESFEEFWKQYPVKVAKLKCSKKWGSLNKSERDEILLLLPDYIKHKPFADYNHPNPETFLNQRRWEDEQFKKSKTIATPIKIKVPEDFYTQSEYEEYCKKNNLVSQWKPMVW